MINMDIFPPGVRTMTDILFLVLLNSRMFKSSYVCSFPNIFTEIDLVILVYTNE